MQKDVKKCSPEMSMKSLLMIKILSYVVDHSGKNRSMKRLKK